MQAINTYRFDLSQAAGRTEELLVSAPARYQTLAVVVVLQSRRNRPALLT
jgi:hypothetical protein